MVLILHFMFPIDVFVLTRSESELNEIYQMLMENLYLVSSALTAMEMTLKTNTNSSSPAAPTRGDIVDIITTL